jgi:hypothetical protein
MTDRLVAEPTGLFPVVFCILCRCFRTQHRCLATVTHGGVIFGRETVCGLPICSPCNASYNEEHVLRCRDHCEHFIEDSSSEKENEQPSKKRSVGAKKPSSANQAAPLKQPKAAVFRSGGIGKPTTMPLLP